MGVGLTIVSFTGSKKGDWQEIAACFREPLYHSAALERRMPGADPEARQIYGPLTPELQKQRDEYVFKKTGRRPSSDQ